MYHVTDKTDVYHVTYEDTVTTQKRLDIQPKNYDRFNKDLVFVSELSRRLD